jgi:hypothetical protein
VLGDVRCGEVMEGGVLRSLHRDGTVPVQVLEAQPAVLGQRMSPRQRHEGRLGPEHLDGQACRVGHREVEQAGVDGPLRTLATCCSGLSSRSETRARGARRSALATAVAAIEWSKDSATARTRDTGSPAPARRVSATARSRSATSPPVRTYSVSPRRSA